MFNHPQSIESKEWAEFPVDKMGGRCGWGLRRVGDVTVVGGVWARAGCSRVAGPGGEDIDPSAVLHCAAAPRARTRHHTPTYTAIHLLVQQLTLQHIFSEQ